ncbi:MAG: hypothetical protein LBE12_17505 [Planctomycetaceae bacterium]|nr:hypothetical protein [Planctomycetaceae bacterium]
MTAINNDTSLFIQCQSEVSDDVLRYSSTVTCVILLTSDRNVLELIVEDAEQIGQQMKRAIAVAVRTKVIEGYNWSVPELDFLSGFFTQNSEKVGNLSDLP